MNVIPVSAGIYLDAGYEFAYAGPGTKPMTPPPPGTALPPVIEAILAGRQKYDTIPVPILALYAVPRLPQFASAEDRQRIANDKLIFAQASAFEKGLPSARVVRVPNAGHEIYRTNEADVLREMHAFLAGLK